MKKYIIILSIGALAVVISCATNPFTGKKSLNFVSNSELFPTSFQQYGTFLKENKVISGTADAKRVENVGIKIKAAAERWLKANGQAEYLKDYQWDYKLIESKEVNAWCMPGGKMVVYTGILPITQNETGLAVVMGHEVSHAIAKHGAERMSEGLLAQGLLVAGQIGLGIAMKDKPAATQNLWNTI